MRKLLCLLAPAALLAQIALLRKSLCWRKSVCRTSGSATQRRSQATG